MKKSGSMLTVWEFFNFSPVILLYLFVYNTFSISLQYFFCFCFFCYICILSKELIKKYWEDIAVWTVEIFNRWTVWVIQSNKHFRLYFLLFSRNLGFLLISMFFKKVAREKLYRDTRKNIRHQINKKKDEELSHVKDRFEIRIVTRLICKEAGRTQ